MGYFAPQYPVILTQAAELVPAPVMTVAKSMLFTLSQAEGGLWFDRLSIGGFSKGVRGIRRACMASHY